MRHFYRIGTSKQLTAASKRSMFFFIYTVKVVNVAWRQFIRHRGNMAEAMHRIAEYAFGRILQFTLAGNEFNSTNC